MQALALILAAAAPASAPLTIAELPVPQGGAEQVVIVQARDFGPGVESGWHVHPGTEIAHVVSGEMELLTKGGVRRLGPGDSFIMPRGEAHNGCNRGTGTTRVMITLVVDRGVPPRQPVPAP